jgi:uncharacterized membrane protein YfcA
MFGLPMEIITMLLSTVGSAYIRMKADSQADLAAERQARAGDIQAVRRFQSPQVSWMRKFITMSFIAMAFIILLAPLLDMPTVVPVEVTSGFKFFFLDFTNTVTEYVTLEGMVTPEYLPHAIMSVVGFYFGNSMAKR